MTVSKSDEIVLCYKCKDPMVLKRGKYGMFLGCTNYPKCNGIIDARGVRIKLKELEMVNIDYSKLYESGEIARIICECSASNEKFEILIRRYRDYIECLEDNNVCYKILEYLHKKHKYIDISIITYAIYLSRGELGTNFSFWINNSEYKSDYYERSIQNIIIKNWNISLFNELNLKYIDQEFFIGSVCEGGGRVDILALDTSDNVDVLIEVKGPKGKAKYAWGQLSSYIKIYQKFNNEHVKAMIISRGYPWGVYEDIFALIGYVIEDNKIVFIPWKI
ncbi:topoisomerase DNA-binding C4 zinc finger domain-containing protein [Clostridium estertheticum]|uniref:topoisomerase DNA-binding C4 zinc finger domain-containing protein n=1 Tax=Clostridium estertheticum TaxID=238834 RepID=UPI00217D6E68|nr:topoisomerase DNA-binding C4 zinc finger domain-containing protein [Clostridium estertheticum]